MPSRYARTPSPPFERLISPGGPFATLLAPRRRQGLALDVHLRERDTATAYCGLTALYTAQAQLGAVRLSAAHSHAQQAPSLFRIWRAGEDGLAEALDAYIRGVQVAPRWTRAEGAVQAGWAEVRTPWVPFDREAVIGYGDSGEAARGRGFPAVTAALAEVGRVAAVEGWAAVPEAQAGAELDQLAVDPAGRLVLLELKHGEASGLYYAPLQLLQYAWEWAGAVEGLLPDLGRLVQARARLGLGPAGLPALSGALRPVLAVGEDLRSAAVRSRTATVLTIANRHLPPQASPIELWSLPGGAPTRVP